ncbi:MAG: hypothetical protein CMH62_03020 [Nanoarchaeota archaeon]|nr:hypothetical protein [Nanoarchaeota archaeon]|tara:strand:+ start:549 stop:2123 length:1575 start_codon:yes stop_codon:yes gene_type:complete
MNKKIFMGAVLIAMTLLLINSVFAAAPTTTTIPTQEWKGVFPWNVDLSTYFTDPESGTLTYTFTRTDTATDITVAISGSTATFTFSDDDFSGDNKITFTATDNETTPLSVTSNEVILRKEQSAFCDPTDGVKIKIGDIDFDDDDYRIGDTVNVDIENVEASVEDLEDVEVEVVLYNVDENKEIDSWEADGATDLDEDEDDDYSVEFVIPNDEDIGKKDEYLLIVHVKADDESGDNQCIQESENIDIERETHDVIVDSFTISPSTITAGETVQLSIRVENIGTKNEDDVYVSLRDSVLGIDYESNRFDLDDYKDSDNDRSVRFVVTIPETTAAGDYIIQPTVYFDDADETNSGEFATLRVRESTGTTGGSTTPSTLSLTTDTQISADKDSANLHLIVTNDQNRDLTGTLSFVPIGDWAQSLTGQPVNLHAGANNLYFTVDLNDAKPGINSATVSVRPAGNSNFEEKQFTLNFDIRGDETSDEGVVSDRFSFLKGRGAAFWVIVDIVLIVVALLVIKAVFGKKTAL